MELVIPIGTKSIEDGAYAGRSDIETVILPEGLERIGEEAFAECVKLRVVRCPNSLKEIGAAAFMECRSLSELSLAEGLELIGDGAFIGSSALKSLRLPTSLRAIMPMAFFGSGLIRIDIPENVEFLGEQAFWACEDLREVNIPGKNTVVEKNALGFCYNLTKGFIAPGFCGISDDAPSELLYSLLALSCLEKHDEATRERAKRFVRCNEQLVMERIFKYSNSFALAGISEYRLLSPDKIDEYVTTSSELNQPQLTALLLAAKSQTTDFDTEFEL